METLVIGVKEAGTMLGLSRSALLERAYKGEIPSFKLGKRRMFSVERLSTWVRDKAGPGSSDETDLPTWAEIGDHTDRAVRQTYAADMQGHRGQVR